MDIQIEIDTIKKELEEIQDESLIQAIKSLLKFARKKTFESGLKPLSIKQYKARAEASEKDIKTGRVKDIDILTKEARNW